MQYDVQMLCDYSNLCGECPLWDNERKRLLWVDSDGTGIFEYDYMGKRSRIISNNMQTSSIVLNKSGMVLLGHGVWLWDGDGEKKKIIGSYGGEELNFNDSIAGPDGCIYAGTYYWNADGMKKYGKLYRISPDHSMQVLDEGIALSNGMAFSLDNALFYYADSGKRSIYVYDFNGKTGCIGNKRIFATNKGDGIPDGITVDGAGHVWCAMWYEGAVYRYDPDGKVERIIHFPVKQVSSVTFGAEQMDLLFITSAKSLFESNLMPQNFDKNVEMGGALYCVQAQITGKAENRVDFHQTLLEKV
jgi:sugar lactone lactonase YvrE